MSDKPDVDDITGLSPAISIEQKGTGHNPRSTVGTVTEIYDYLRLLFGRAGTPHCPKCGREVHRYSVDEIIDLIFKEYDGKPLEIYSPVVKGKKGEYKNLPAETAPAGLYARAHRRHALLARRDGRARQKAPPHDRVPHRPHEGARGQTACVSAKRSRWRSSFQTVSCC